MQVVRGTQVQGLHPRVSRGGAIGAKRPAALEQRCICTGPRQIPAGEKEVDLVLHRLQAVGKCPSKLPAPNDTYGERHRSSSSWTPHGTPHGHWRSQATGADSRTLV